MRRFSVSWPDLPWEDLGPLQSRLYMADAPKILTGEATQSRKDMVTVGHAEKIHTET